MKFKKMKSKIAAITTPLLIFATRVSASDIQNSKYATGTTKMVRDIGAVFTILIPIAAVAFIGFQQLTKYYSNHDGQVTTEANKRTKAALWTAVIGTTATGLVTLITNYYV
ncbi:hypothetical protein BSK66_27760 [Paenibacillus odorifer]|uniref:hypothetical protein n=1 Tax=Paenibacillus TaxID=44249 RepID=UPI0003E297E2|nr:MULTISPECIES: hypothetical protein [Paenibacillus]ETT61280.1 hypothetical protein C171_12488 [Paenibacillus sp. FSL H8-237]OMD13754.1 hypothetical protein BJP47_24310 [Paenibacillus odorifer]OME48984.1 hypothetical protein BSK66_27760 [Paenibacillus odorifer]